MSESAGARRLPTVAVVILVAAVVGVAGLVAGSALTSAGERVSRPAEGSAEAGFARDMQAHHAQAVEMSTMVRDGTEDPEVRSLALDILLTQQQQAGQMYGWLEQWDLPQASLAAPMQWMSEPGSGMGSTTTGSASSTMGSVSGSSAHAVRPRASARERERKRFMGKGG